jgi:Tfp pilus assembly protein FimT
MNANSPEKGISLVDLVIVLTVVGILVTLAIPQFNKTYTQFTRQNVAQELKVFLDRARFDSVKRHAKGLDQMASVTINSATGFTLSSDLNSDGSVQANEVRQISFDGKSNTKIVGTNLVFPIVIRFNHRGQVTAVDGNNSQITPDFIICEQNCTPQTANNENANTLTISKAGNVSIYDGSKTAATLSNPDVSNVTTTTKIKQNVTVSNSVYLE